MASENGIELKPIETSSNFRSPPDYYDNFGFTSTTQLCFDDKKSNFAKERLNCSHHPTYEIMFYCKECCQPVCSQCMINHPDHHMSSFTTAITTLYGNLLDHIQKLNILSKSLKESQHTTLERRKLMEKSTTEAKNMVDHQFALLHAKLDAVYSEMTEAITSASSTYFYKCDKLVESISLMSKAIEPYNCMTADVHKNLKSEMDIFVLENSARKELEIMQSRMSEFVAPDFEIITLKWNPSISDMFAKNSSIGSVHVQNNLLECYQLSEFSARHVNDKNTPRIDSIAALENGNIVVIDSNNSKLKVFSNTGKLLFCFVGAGKYNVPSPRRVIALPNNKMVVSDYTSKIVLFNTNGTGFSIFATDSASNGMCFYGSKLSSDSFIHEDIETQINEKFPDQSNSEIEALVTNDFSQNSNPIVRNKKSSSKIPVRRSDSQATLRSLDQECDEMMQYDILMGNNIMRCMEILQISGKHFRKSQEDIELKLDAKQYIRALNIATSPLNNNIYLIDENSKALLVFDHCGTYLYSYDRCRNPVNVLCDKQGNILVLDSFTNLIHVLDAECNFLQNLRIQKKAKSLNSSNLLLAELHYPATFTLNHSGNFLIIAHDDGLIKCCSYGKS